MRRHPTTTLQHLTAGLILVCLLASALAPPATAQVQHWDNIKARNDAERLHSKALNSLIIYSNTGRVNFLDQAITILLQATNTDPTDPVPLATLGLALDMKGRYPEALDALDNALKNDPTNAETAMALALTHYLQHNFSKALEVLNKLLTDNPQMTVAYAYAGYCYLRAGDLEKAKDCFKNLVKAQATSQLGNQGSAINNLMAGDLTEAHANCEQALSIGKYPPTMLVMAKIDAFEGLPAQTRNYAEQYNRLTRKGLVQRPMTELGFAKSHDFHWDPLLADNFQNGYLIMALTLNLPKQAGKQRSYCHQGHADAKLMEAQNALSLYPDDYWLANEVGLLQLESGQYDGAEATFKKVLQLAPKCHIALYEIASAFAHDGKTSQAASAICEFHRLHPTTPVPDYLIELAKSIPTDKLPAPLLQEPGPANGIDGQTQIPSGF